MMTGYQIGEKLHGFRKKAGLTQAEVAELAELSDRTYADIERGTVNMRTDTMLKICKALQITPNDMLMDSHPSLTEKQEELLRQLRACSYHERETALTLLSVYLQSVQKK